MLTFLHIQKVAFVVLKLRLGIPQLSCHSIVPLFDALKHTLVLVVLVLADLFFRLFYLLFFEDGERCKIICQLFQPEVGLGRILLVTPVAIGHVVAQVDCLLHDLFESFSEDALRTLVTGLVLLFLYHLRVGSIRLLLRHAYFGRLPLAALFFLLLFGRILHECVLIVALVHFSVLHCSRLWSLLAIFHTFEALAELFMFAVDLKRSDCLLTAHVVENKH